MTPPAGYAGQGGRGLGGEERGAGGGGDGCGDGWEGGLCMVVRLSFLVLSVLRRRI